MIKESSYFIWTEIFNCGKIGRIALKTFVKHHPHLKVHVFGTAADFKWIEPHPQIETMTLPNRFRDRNLIAYLGAAVSGKMTEPYLLHCFKKGHWGTANLWAYLIKSRSEKYLMHFDSDVVFKGNLFDEIIQKTQDFDLIGPVRNYPNNPYHRDDLRYLPDIVQTVCFAFNKERIDRHRFYSLAKMCQGYYNPLGHPVIDFFDPVSFNILKNGGKVSFLNPDDVGGANLQGNRKNKYADLNDFPTPFKIDYGDKLIHFSAVGSGMNIYHHPGKVKMPAQYKKYALDRYALFCMVFYNEDLGFDLKMYKPLIDNLQKLEI